MSKPSDITNDSSAALQAPPQGCAQLVKTQRRRNIGTGPPPGAQRASVRRERGRRASTWRSRRIRASVYVSPLTVCLSQCLFNNFSQHRSERQRIIELVEKLEQLNPERSSIAMLSRALRTYSYALTDRRRRGRRRSGLDGGLQKSNQSFKGVLGHDHMRASFSARCAILHCPFITRHAFDCEKWQSSTRWRRG
jgi:hypothetical protein